MSRERVLEVLDSIVDSCSAAAGVPAGLVTMGLVTKCEVTPTSAGAVVEVAIRVTEPSCLMGLPFAQEAKRRLMALEGVASVDVALDPSIDWSPADMAPEYRVRLAATRAERKRALTSKGDAV